MFRQIEHQIDHIRRTAALENFDAFGDFERVTDGPPERFVHRTEKMRDLYAHQFPHFCHGGGELFGLLVRLHERAAPKLHVEHQPIEILRELLAHDARHDERLGRDGAGHIAQGVEFSVGGADIGGLSDDENPMLSSCASARRSSMWTLNPGMLSSLSSVPPVMPSPRPQIIGTQTSSQASNGASTSETLSPMPPVECLSTLRRSALWILQDAPAFHHRLREMMGFRRRHPSEKDRHRPRAHLIIGDLVLGESRDEVRDFLGSQFAAFAFLFDECRDVHGKDSDRARNGTLETARGSHRPL